MKQTMKKGDIDELELIWDNYSFTPFLRTVLNEELLLLIYVIKYIKFELNLPY